MQKQEVSILRYKKDLRVLDHQPLHDALWSWLPVVWVFCFEPHVMAEEDWSGFHGQIMKEWLIDLSTELQKLWIPLLVYNMEVLDCLERLWWYVEISHIYAHEETWNMVTYERDIAVIDRCKTHRIWFHESPTNGIVRRLWSRDDRDKIWKKRMADPILELPSPQVYIDLPKPLVEQTLNLHTPRKCEHIQKWGIYIAHEYLESFLDHRFQKYLYHVWRPYESVESCSRLSPYITYGNLSIKQIYHATKAKRRELAANRYIYEKWSMERKQYASYIRHLDSFTSRLHRHDHFIQKLESSMQYELWNIHPYYDRIRNKPDQDIIHARKTWQTWYPLIDAAMRCLAQTWWINFRLRATVTSFICNTCLQDRREISKFLWSVFIDYEPGIHYSQLQMQSWTAGINQYRIYNPTKQILDKDADGKFIDLWVPELRDIPMPMKAEPWKIQWGLFEWSYGVELGIDYPFPIVDLEQANKKARDILRGIKKSEWFREIAQDIYIRHGSRKKSRKKKT